MMRLNLLVCLRYLIVVDALCDRISEVVAVCVLMILIGFFEAERCQICIRAEVTLNSFRGCKKQ